MWSASTTYLLCSIPVRWCDTQGEQCHAKIIVTQKGQETSLLLGSANFTRRNLDNFNLESNVVLRAHPEVPAWRAAADYFDEQWNNTSDRSYTVAYEVHRDESWYRRWLYRWMEATGLSTF